ncbi:MAG TPA: acetyl-CoA carboxylase carboxyltransferase subunit alpha [bacterium]|nr:acetyl-CoA carboxylase carboxyltransferase subunit alpha [bacterium]HQG47120.1 acetyl-CoA carboxylase carboxyltransferase subunit alpha [bacterium]HQI49147.1 acetyl-CoA carboxylase carboxyltransferase subunit alpha [bacterium]HQJ66071.1 acetyl-CoA carboxylase carboxyltransferase subunit alpha [bacterium]
MAGLILEFEKPIAEIERRIAELREYSASEDLEMHKEIERLEEKARQLREEVYSNLTRWQRVQLARHPNRPYTLDYVRWMMPDFMELHGDRAFADDPAIVCGIGTLGTRPVTLIGHQKARDTREKIRRNFGMPNPEGYRKALRLMRMSARFKRPVICLVDTPGAFPGTGGEERGQAEAIARNLFEMAHLPVPIVVVIIGEGASGGALGIGVGDRILMLENTWYSVITPEGCAAILYRDSANAPLAAEAMKVAPADLLELGVIDRILKEPRGGAHNDHEGAAALVKEALVEELEALAEIKPAELVRRRIDKFAHMGVWDE